MSGFRIDTITAFVAIDPTDDDEGITAFLDPATNVWMPMVAADGARLEELRRMADVFRMAGTEVTEVRFQRLLPGEDSA